MKRKYFLALILTSFITACSTSGSNQQDYPKVSLTISVAASLQDAMKTLKTICLWVTTPWDLMNT